MKTKRFWVFAVHDKNWQDDDFSVLVYERSSTANVARAREIRGAHGVGRIVAIDVPLPPKRRAKP